MRFRQRARRREAEHNRRHLYNLPAATLWRKIHDLSGLIQINPRLFRHCLNNLPRSPRSATRIKGLQWSHNVQRHTAAQLLRCLLGHESGNRSKRPLPRNPAPNSLRPVPAASRKRTIWETIGAFSYTSANAVSTLCNMPAAKDAQRSGDMAGVR